MSVGFGGGGASEAGPRTHTAPMCGSVRLPAAAGPDRRLVLPADHVSRSPAVSGSAAGSSPSFLRSLLLTALSAAAFALCGQSLLLSRSLSGERLALLSQSPAANTGRGSSAPAPSSSRAWKSTEAPAEEKENMSLPTLSPAVPPYVTLGLTVVYTVFYSLLFIFIYVQLWLVLRYRHKRFSYQTVFLFLCLLWSALRTVLFSFYFKNFVTANTLGPFPFWLLYCFPVCLQFFTLSLMNLYFAQVS